MSKLYNIITTADSFKRPFTSRDIADALNYPKGKAREGVSTMLNYLFKRNAVIKLKRIKTHIIYTAPTNSTIEEANSAWLINSMKTHKCPPQHRGGRSDSDKHRAAQTFLLGEVRFPNTPVNPPRYTIGGQ